MRIQFSQLIPQGGGPGVFTNRLLEHLRLMPGVEIISSKPDIFFAVIRVEEKLPKRAKVVLRLDGLYWDTARQGLNTPIFKSVQRSQAIVFQSQFSKQCYEHRIKVPFNRVIYNGIDLNWVNQIEPMTLPQGPGLVACADWRPTKRPNSICTGFIQAALPCPLYMTGKTQNPIVHEKIHWLGPKSPAEVLSVFKACTHAVHLAKFDACPNTVIEQLVCGLPVLHSANGGTPELVRTDGVCFPVDGDWNYSAQPNTSDNIDPIELVPYMHTLYSMPKIGPRPDLSIEIVANQYYQFFKEVLAR